MAPLRKIVPRERDEPTTTDLRGLGQDPLLQQSSPYTCLSVHDLKDGASSERFKSILTKYDLVVDYSSSSSVHHLHKRSLIEGTHKIQAISLFLAALELHRAFPKTHLYLHEVSRLHLQMHEALSKKSQSPQHPDQRMQAWLKKPHSVSIDVTIVQHLSQAGFELSHSDATLNWTPEQAELMHIKLSKVESQQLRKVA